jgi:hypothetical protein
MRRLILEEWISLDGFAVDREGTFDFFPASEADRFSDRDQLEFLESVDTILLGRRTYELFVERPRTRRSSPTASTRCRSSSSPTHCVTPHGEPGTRRESCTATPWTRSSG